MVPIGRILRPTYELNHVRKEPQMIQVWDEGTNSYTTALRDASEGKHLVYIVGTSLYLVELTHARRIILVPKGYYIGKIHQLTDFTD